MSTPTHTPGPWIAEQNMIRQPNGSKRRRIVCPPDHDGMQDAAYIVRACNAHEELVKALKKARAALYNVPEVGKKYDQQHSDTHLRACLEIDQALALAERP